MTRAFTTAGAAALDASHVPMLVFVELDFASGVLRLATSMHDVSWNGSTWLGAGRVLAIEGVAETGSVEAQGVAISLSTADTSIIPIALNQQYQGRAARIYAATVNPDTGAFAEVRLIYRGRMDVMTLQDGADACTVQVRVENRLADLTRARVSRYSHADQQSRFPADTGLRYVDYYASDRDIKWGIA